MEILVKGFWDNAGTYGNMCTCDSDCDCNCNAVIGDGSILECAQKYGYLWTGCNRYTPRE